MACKYILDGKEYTEQEFNALAERQFMNRPKTRRILEVQSDLFQKGRDKSDLITKQESKNDSSTSNSFNVNGVDYGIWSGVLNSNGEDEYYKQESSASRKIHISKEEFNMARSTFDNTLKPDSKENQFLQLLNKDGNWIPFFLKTIIQDSAKQTILEADQKDIDDKIQELKNSGKLQIIC